MSAAERLVRLLRERGLTVTTAESMTGGLIAGAITAVPGASEVLSLGLCTYSNVMKQRFLGVSDRTLAAHTEISAPCAREMARGAAALSGADLAVSVTGLAGARTWKTPLLRGRPDDGTVFVGVWFGGRAKAYGDRRRSRGARQGVACGKGYCALCLRCWLWGRTDKSGSECAFPPFHAVPKRRKTGME